MTEPLKTEFIDLVGDVICLIATYLEPLDYTFLKLVCRHTNQALRTNNPILVPELYGYLAHIVHAYDTGKFVRWIQRNGSMCLSSQLGKITMSKIRSPSQSNILKLIGSGPCDRSFDAYKLWFNNRCYTVTTRGEYTIVSNDQNKLDKPAYKVTFTRSQTTIKILVDVFHPGIIWYLYKEEFDLEWFNKVNDAK